MARTRPQFRQLVAQQFDAPYLAGTTTASSGSTLTDAPTFGIYNDDKLIGAWAYLTDATVKDRRVTDSTQAGVLTIQPDDNASLDGTDAYEILPFAGSAIHDALDEVLLSLFNTGELVRPLWLNHWLTGSPIYNSTFDYWTGAAALDGWTVSNSTLSRLTYSSDLVVPGDFAVRLVNTGTLTLDTKHSRFLREFGGFTPTLYAWVRSDTASSDRVQILEDGSLTGSSGYHSGDGTWELLKLDRSIPDSVTDITVRLDHTGAGNGDYGAIWFIGGPVAREYPMPIGLMPNGPDVVRVGPVSLDDGNKVTSHLSGVTRPMSRWTWYRYRHEDSSDEVGVLRFNGVPPAAQQRMWMPGKAPFTLPTSETSLVEVTEADAVLIAKLTAIRLIEKTMFRGSASFRGRARETISRLTAEADEIKEGRSSYNDDVTVLGPTW